MTADQSAPDYLDPVRDELDRLRTAENDAVRAYDDTLVKLADSMADADRLLARLELAEARVDQLLTDADAKAHDHKLRSDALDRCVESLDQLRATLAKASRWVAHFEESIEAACDEEDAVCHGYDVTDDGRCALLADVGQLRAIIRGDARD